MKNYRSILITFGLAWTWTAVAAPVQTNEAQQKALDVLRKAIENIEAKPVVVTKPGTKSGHEPTFPEAERLFLQGQLSAKEFQKYLDNHKIESAKPSETAAEARAAGALGKELRKSEAGRPGATVAKPAIPAVNPPPRTLEGTAEPEPAGLSEVEKKMDELLRLKAARESAAATNAIANTLTNGSAPAKPKTKRERLNDLLLMVVAGKITDAQYKEERAKLINEPD